MVGMTFGYELEFLGANLETVSKKYAIPLYTKGWSCNYRTFILSGEQDVTNILTCEGGELISPIYMENDKLQCLKELKEKLEILKEEKAYLRENADGTGFHIHLGRQCLVSKERKRMLLKFLVAFQPEIFKLACGEYNAIRANYLKHAQWLTKQDVEDEIRQSSKRELLHQKTKCFRFTKETFELRHFNSSLDFSVLESYLQFAWHLYAVLETGDIDLEELEFYYRKYYYLGLEPNEVRRNAMERMLKME